MPNFSPLSSFDETVCCNHIQQLTSNFEAVSDFLCFDRLEEKGSPFSIAEHRVLELISVLCSQPAGDVSNKPGGSLTLLSTRPAVTLTILERAGTSFAA